MIKKFINYGSQYIDEDDIKFVVNNLKSSLITQGTTVTNFEKNCKFFLVLNMQRLFQTVLQLYF